MHQDENTAPLANGALPGRKPNRRFGDDLTNDAVGAQTRGFTAVAPVRAHRVTASTNDKQARQPGIPTSTASTAASRLDSRTTDTGLLQKFESLLAPSRSSAGQVTDIDAKDAGDQFCVPEYIHEIYAHLKENEGKYLPNPNYMAAQTDLNERMRSILVDWLVEVHLKFKLRHETLFLTVNILDRFLEKQKIARNRLQLAGVTCMLLAAKYEEVFPPEVRDFVYICDNAYTRDQILEMEPIVCNRLEFNFTTATPHTFLKRFVKAAAPQGNDTLYLLTCYLLELCLPSMKSLTFTPSMLSAAAVSLASKMLNMPSWTPTLAKYTGYSETDLTACVREIHELAARAPQSSLRAAHRKYSTTRFRNVASTPVCDL